MGLWRQNEPRSIRRIVNYFGVAFVGTLLPSLPFAGSLLLPEANDGPTDQIIGGFFLTLSMVVPALPLAVYAHSKDRQLFAVTPMSLQMYYRRRLNLNWPYPVMAVVVVPAVSVIALLCLYEPTADERFRWTPLMVVEAVTAYYALLLAPVAVFVRWFRAEGRSANSYAPVVFVGLVYALFILGFVFRRRLGFALGIILEFLLSGGTPGLFLIGAISPGSLLALQGNGFDASAAGTILIAVWMGCIAIELIMLFQGMRRLRPRQEVGNLQAADPVVTKQQVTRVFPVRGMPVVESEYITDGHPEFRLLRLLAYTAPIRTNSIKLILSDLFLRFPRLFVLLAISGFSFTPDSGAQSAALFAALFAPYSNLLSGARWAPSLRCSLGLPIRLNRLSVQGYGLQLWYRITVDFAASVLIVYGFRLNPWDVIPVFCALLIARACGQLRSWLSLLSVAGLRRATWLYEVPLLVAPVILLAICDVAIEFWKSDLIWYLPVIAAGWLIYGIALAGWLSRATDTSIPRVSSSYRPGIQEMEAI
jgi:hypothetical protein